MNRISVKYLAGMLSWVVFLSIVLSTVAVHAESNSSSAYAVGDSVFLGSYEQDNDISNGAEPLQWQILEMDGDQALLLSTYVIDNRAYHDSDEGVTWSKSELRAWLNDTFFSTAFTIEEQSAILESYVVNNSLWGVSAGPDTNDRVFLLGQDEVKELYPEEEARQTKPTRYAREQGAGGSGEFASWWLRSTGPYSNLVEYDNTGMTNLVAYVSEDGGTSNSGSAYREKGIRPVIQVDLRSTSIYKNEEETAKQEELGQPGRFSVGQSVFLGNYRQEVDDETPKLIEWEILRTQGDRLLVISKKTLDMVSFDDGDAKTWEDCSLRAWLNGAFYQDVFTEEEQTAILPVINTNCVDPLGFAIDAPETEDWVFLLSREEAEEFFANESYRKGIATDYCGWRDYQLRGAFEATYTPIDGWWWLRDVGEYLGTIHAAMVGYKGEFLTNVTDAMFALRPAMWLDASVIAALEDAAVAARAQAIIDAGGIVAISASSLHTVVLKENGTTVASGDNWNGQCDVEAWTDLIAVAAGTDHTVGLRKDGTVVATGANDNGQCDVEGWTDIVAIAAGGWHTVGLRSNGTVIATGRNQEGQCNVEDWTDIVSISARHGHTVGLREDGTVLATGWNERGQCKVRDWTDIVAISAGTFHTVGLKKDGTVIATKVKETTENYATQYYDHGQSNVDGWMDIVAISAGNYHTVGLKSDGTVVGTEFVIPPADLSTYYAGQCDVEDWSDIAAISAGYEYTMGLKRDGTITGVGFVEGDMEELMGILE